MTTMMACGHASNGYRIKDGEKLPSCVICGTIETAPQPDLTGRLSVCTYYRGDRTDRDGKCPPTRHNPRGGGDYPSVADSSTGLPFFKHRPDRTNDSHFCGCWGWD